MSKTNCASRCVVPIVTLLSLLISLSIPNLTVTAQSSDNVELRTLVTQIPATGTFTLGVYYVATGNRALVAEVQLKANPATKFGRGSVTVTGGTGATTITVTLANNPTPSDTLYELNLWSVDTNTFQNGNNPNAFDQRTSNTRYNVVLGTPAAPTQPPIPQATTRPPTTPPQGTRAPTLAPGQTPRPGNPTPPPDLTIPTPEPSDPSTPTDPTNPNPGTDPNNPGTDPTPDPGSDGGDRVCKVTDNNVVRCSGCGYTICRNSQPIYQLCDVGSCNPLTQQCDATLPQCTDGPQTRQNSGAAPQQMICWTILMVLGAIGSWIL